MSGEITSALAATMGALVGGVASLTSTWLGERSQRHRDLLEREIVKRETAYSQFIEQAAKLYVASATHNFNDGEGAVAGTVELYAVASRIRLFASESVIKETENVLDLIIMQYGADNISAEQLRIDAVEKRDDFLKAFSVTCRRELQDFQR